MTRTLILHCISPLIANALNPLCYLYYLMGSIQYLNLSGIPNLILKLIPSMNLITFSALEGIKKYITRQTGKPHLILSSKHAPLRQILKMDA